MNTTKKVCIVLLVLIPFFMFSCLRRELSMVFITDGEKLEKRFEQILTAIKNKDKNLLRSQFSNKVIEESKQFDEDMDYLFSFFQGDVVSYEQGGVSGGDRRHYGERVSELSCRFDVNAPNQKYIAYILEYTEDTVNPDNIGLYTLIIIKEEDRALQPKYWQDMIIPGIYRYQEVDAEVTDTTLQKPGL